MKRISGKSASRRRESGVALIIALIMLLVLSMVAAGLLFSTQVEIWSTANYRTTIQARYVAESGAQQAIYYFSNSTVLKASLAAQNFTTSTSYNVAANPISYGGQPVFFQSNTSDPVTNITNTSGATTSTYPSSATVTDFQNNVGDGAAVNSTSFAPLNNGAGAHYSVAVQLLSAQPTTNPTGFAVSLKIVSVGTVIGVRRASVQVTEIYNGVITPTSTTIPLFSYAALATGTGCNTMTLHASGYQIGSYDSTASTLTTAFTKGDVASAGEINLSNGYKVSGNFFTSLNYANMNNFGSAYNDNGVSNTVGYYKSGSGTAYNPSNAATCTTTNGVPNIAIYEDNSGSGIYANMGSTYSDLTTCAPWSGMTKSQCLAGFNTPQSIDASVFTSVSSVSIPTVADNTASCSADYYGVCGGGMTYYDNTLGKNPWTGESAWNSALGGYQDVSGNSDAYQFALSPSTTTNYGNVTISSPTTLHLSPGTYNFNTLKVTGAIVLDLPSTCTAANIASTACTVTINIIGNTSSSTVVDFSSGQPLVNVSTVDGKTIGIDGDLLIQYNGTKTIDLSSGGVVSATIDAPNAIYSSLGGGGKLYGAVIAKTINVSSGDQIYYDLNLKNGKQTPVGSTSPSALYLTEFSWNSY